MGEPAFASGDRVRLRVDPLKVGIVQGPPTRYEVREIGERMGDLADSLVLPTATPLRTSERDLRMNLLSAV